MTLEWLIKREGPFHQAGVKAAITAGWWEARERAANCIMSIVDRHKSPLEDTRPDHITVPQ